MINEILREKVLTASPITSKEIIKIFSYNTDETDTFPYLYRYMKLISKKLIKVENEERILKRFALAGLFLTYRAYNHSRALLTTENPSDFDLSDIHSLRLATFKYHFKTEIYSSDHYLKMIGFSAFEFVLLAFRLSDISEKLYRFVIK